MGNYTEEINRRRTFAIISHPDAGKTTLTEKFLLYGGAINLAGSVKGKATARHAVSDWMEIEKERGISVTSSVLQFNYNGFCIKAPAYMVIYSDVADHYLENAGYIAQGLTLKMTELGLAACWQTINDADEAKKALGEDTDKVVACVVAFGYRDPDNNEKKAPKKSLDEMTDGYRFGQDIDTDLWYNELEDGLRAIAHAQSFQNLQPYKIIVDNDQISLIGLPDDMTSEADRLLNYGIVMFNFYAVMWAIRPTAPRWSFEPVTDRDLGLPADVTYVAKCGL